MSNSILGMFIFCTIIPNQIETTDPKTGHLSENKNIDSIDLLKKIPINVCFSQKIISFFNWYFVGFWSRNKEQIG